MIPKLKPGVHSFVSLSVCGLQVLVQGGKRERWREGGKVEGGFPWFHEAQSFSCETQYPWLDPKHGAGDARLPSKGKMGWERMEKTGVPCNKHRRAFTSQCTRVIRRAHFLHIQLPRRPVERKNRKKCRELVDEKKNAD